jgi:hypothetical protein
MTFYKAQFYSRYFDFNAYGKTEAESIEVLKKGLNNHAKQYGIEPDWWKEYECDIYSIEVGLNGCYRDNEPILEKP